MPVPIHSELMDVFIVSEAEHMDLFMFSAEQTDRQNSSDATIRVEMMKEEIYILHQSPRTSVGKGQSKRVVYDC